ncbi:MAG TPA: aspartate aminotransferase family protein [Terriglobia bacterium]|nr:aspartate aminotransferase family protein [Terriglobia bacterium]
MANSYELIPRSVPLVETKHRKICTPIPVPESIPILEKLRQFEPESMSGQPLVLWDRAEGFNVYDRWGNKWIDWSSGVLITNAGHGRKEIADAIVRQAQKPLLTNYCFPSEIRAALVEKLVEMSPKPLEKAFLLTTGSETIECAIKLARTHGIRRRGREKVTIVSFERDFHGRTLGAQMAGGIPSLKDWIVNLDPAMIQVPFPDGFRTEDVSFGLFEKSLASQNVKPENVAGVLLETYQGGGASFAPKEYIQALRQWCDRHQVLLIFDEVQAGFGRTGTLFGFEQYGIVPDLACFGKGITSSLPLSAVLGRKDVMDLYPPGSMTSTHTGNPICVAAALASLEIVLRENLAERAARVGSVLQQRLAKMKNRFSTRIGAHHGKGLVAALHMVKENSREPDTELAWNAVRRSVESGLLFFSPVGYGGANIKISPPLTITEEAVLEGSDVLGEAIGQCIEEGRTH